MIDPGVALFAIEASVRLGRKLEQILVDETAERPLLMPLGDLFGSVTEAEAMRFYTVDQPELIQPGGVCHTFRDDRPRLINFYRALRGVEIHAGFGDPIAQRQRLVGQLSAVDQFDREFQAHHPARRILGTVVEIGIDYFTARPEALGRDSAARRILGAFVAGLSNTEFAEGTGRQILGDLLGAALRSLEGQADLIEDDPRLAALLGGVSSAVADELERARAEENMLSRRQLLRRIGSSIIRGSASAFAGDVPLFAAGDHGVRQWVHLTVGQILSALRDHEDLFTGEVLESIVQVALRAAAENPGLLTGNRQLQALIEETVAVLADPNSLFARAAAGAVVVKTLELARERKEMIGSVQAPGPGLPARALAAVDEGLSVRLAGRGGVRDLLVPRQVVAIANLVLQESAVNPGLLSGAGTRNRAVLAQVIASIARALGSKPARFTHGDDFIRLVRAGIGATVSNPDLVDVGSASPTTNLLYRILQQIVSALARPGTPRALSNRATFVEVVERVLPLASANSGVLGSKGALVGAALDAALAVARTSLAGRVNGANFGAMAEHLLGLALWDEPDLKDGEKLAQAARTFLRNHSVARYPACQHQGCVMS